MTDTSTTDNAAGGLPESGRWGSRAKIALTRR
jgi:hypothetical protein